jgi:hypothetical protein
MWWTEHLSLVGEKRNFGRKAEESNYLKDLDVDGKTMLKWIIKE